MLTILKTLLKRTNSGMVIVICSFSAQINANPNQMTSVDAIRIVEEYKILRNMCAAAKEEARKACFAELGEKNGTYRKAKKILENKRNLEGEAIYSAN